MVGSRLAAGLTAVASQAGRKDTEACILITHLMMAAACKPAMSLFDLFIMHFQRHSVSSFILAWCSGIDFWGMGFPGNSARGMSNAHFSKVDYGFFSALLSSSAATWCCVVDDA